MQNLPERHSNMTSNSAHTHLDDPAAVIQHPPNLDLPSLHRSHQKSGFTHGITFLITHSEEEDSWYPAFQ